MSQAFETWKSMNAADRKVFAPLTVNVADDNTIAVPAYPFQEIQVAEVSAPASFQGVHLTKVCPLISTSSPVQLTQEGREQAATLAADEARATGAHALRHGLEKAIHVMLA